MSPDPARTRADSPDRHAAHSDESGLVRACAEGDPAAWARLVDRYARLAYSIPRSYGLPNDLCEDTCQNVFRILFRRLGRLGEIRSLSGWITTTTHRETWRQVRAARRRRAEVIAEVATRDPTPELIEAWERRYRIDRALRQLGGRCEELLRLLFLDPARPTYQSVAARLGVPVGSLGAWRGRCLRKLMTVWDELESGQRGQ